LSSPDTTDPAALLAPVLEAIRALTPTPAGHPRQPVVLIDGPSGAGKSTLADALLTAWPGPIDPVLVRLDDIYPGWGGLDAAVEHIGDRVLAPRRAGRPAAWQRHDWATGTPAEWHDVDAGRPLIVEGCGALARAHAALSDVRVWLDADDGIRKHRALTRDGGGFEAHWDQWQRDWERYRARERPEGWATLCLTATPGSALGPPRPAGAPGATAAKTPPPQ
jgi:hypothetical protein